MESTWLLRCREPLEIAACPAVQLKQHLACFASLMIYQTASISSLLR